MNTNFSSSDEQLKIECAATFMQAFVNQAALIQYCRTHLSKSIDEFKQELEATIDICMQIASDTNPSELNKKIFTEVNQQEAKALAMNSLMGLFTALKNNSTCN